MPNPGLAAFDPGLTRLVPLPRKSDAPALAELPEVPASALKASALNALAQANAPPAKPEAAPTAHRRGAAKSAPRRDFARQLGSAYQDWADYRGWSNNRAEANTHTWRGGPKSGF
jgi:septal ring-binding cell division protein DamX